MKTRPQPPIYQDMVQCTSPLCFVMIDRNYIEDTKAACGRDHGKCSKCRGEQ